MTTNEDDFWNDSTLSHNLSRSKFFDNDDESTLSDAQVLGALEQESITLSINSIISNKCLKIIIDDTDSFVEYTVPPAEETVKRMFYEDNFIWNTYRTLDSKLQLLDAAIDICDGNIIIAVILFLGKSLNNNVFFTQLAKRKVAVKHYVNYLIEKNLLEDLADLYMATGNIQNLKDIYALLSRDNSNKCVLHKKLEHFNIHHAAHLYNIEDKLEVQENMSFLEFQLQHKFSSKSLIEQLADMCRNEWANGNSDEVLYTFKKQFNLDNFQFEWVIMSVLCNTENWSKLVHTFTKSVWMSKKRALKSVIRPELFVLGIGRHNAPENIIEQFLHCIGDSSKSLYLAEKLRMHMYVVNYYTEQKDKMALLKYMEKIEGGNPALYTIQSNLSNPEIKWKN